MTVANVIFDGQRVRLVCDTLSYMGAKPFSLNRKLRLVEKSRVIFTVRGRRMLADFLEDRSGFWTDFESAVCDINSAVREWGEDCLTDAGCEITVAGWCCGKAAVTKLSAHCAGAEVNVDRVDLVPGVYLAPGLGDQTIPVTMTDEQAFKVALLQQQISRKHGLLMCIGGDLEPGEVAGGTVSIRKLGEYPDKADTVAALARKEAALDNDQLAA